MAQTWCAWIVRPIEEFLGTCDRKLGGKSTKGSIIAFMQRDDLCFFFMWLYVPHFGGDTDLGR